MHSVEKRTGNNQLQKLVNSIVELLIAEVDKDENKLILRVHVIHPILRLIYEEVYPYIMFTLGVIIVILLISLIILGLLVIFYRST